MRLTRPVQEPTDPPNCFGSSYADRSVDTFERLLKLGERLPGFYLSPQGYRPTLQPANRLEAIAFDHSLDAGKAIACVGVANWHHPAILLPTAAFTLSPIAQDGVASRGRRLFRRS